MNSYVYVNNNPLLGIDPTGKVNILGALATAIAAAKLAANVCKNYPALCRELKKCITSPKKCAKKFCSKSVNSIKHSICDSIGGSCGKGSGANNKSCTSLRVMQAANKTCLALRKFEIKVCYSGRDFTKGGHTKKIQNQQKRVQKCDKLIERKCNSSLNCISGSM